MTNFADKLDGWLPIRMYLLGGEPFFDWCHFGDEAIGEPFFDLAVERRLRVPFNLLLRPQTPLAVLRDVAAARPALRPRGFVFHLSRCGSTLVSQMLAAIPENLVLSEPTVLSQALRARGARPDLGDAEHAERFRLAVGALGQKRIAAAERLYIKFDGADTVFFDDVARAFPEVPWIFLYREPVEIIVSHLRLPSPAGIPGALGFAPGGLGFFEAASLPPEEFVAHMLADVCRAALVRRDDPRGMFVNYSELPGAFGRIARHFGGFDETQTAAMTAAAEFDAKAPSRRFKGDSEEKRRAAGPEVVAAADAIVRPLYDELERVRSTRAGDDD